MLYAIQHINGNFLPANHPGSSFWAGECGDPPRLFKTLGAARGWITNWLKGPLVKNYSQEWEMGYEESYWVHEPDESRHRELLRIIPVTLTFGEPQC